MAMGGLTRQIIFRKMEITVSFLRLMSRSSPPMAARTARGCNCRGQPGTDFQGRLQPFHGKEIHEQPDAISHTLASMTGEDGHLTAAPLDAATLKGLDARRRYITNAAMIGKYWFEDLADLPVVTRSRPSSGIRNPSFRHLDLAVGISQSGESLDTLMALRHAAENGIRTMGVINVPEA